MQSIFYRTFGGLSRQQYLRHLFFGFIVFAILFLPALSSDRSVPTPALFFGVICTFLYPYSRFVYERIMHFIIGDNRICGSVLVVGIAKLLTIGMCWAFAMFVAPIGLLWLYFDNKAVADTPTTKADE